MNKKDGGPAFPSITYKDESGYVKYSIDRDEKISILPTGNNDGMSLRDWFAGMTLSGIWASETEDAHYTSHGQRAKIAYAAADAMIKEREDERTEQRKN